MRQEDALLIVTARTGGRLVGLLPGYLTRRRMLGGRGTVFAFLGSEHESSDYLTIIQADPADQDLSRQFLEYLSRMSGPRIDLMLWSNILDDNPLLHTIRRFSRESGARHFRQHHRICPFLTVEGDWESYLKRLSGNMRQQVLRRRKKFFRGSGGRCRQVTDRDALAASIHTLFNLHERRFDSKEERSKFNRLPRKVFHSRVAHQFLDLDMLRLFELLVDDRVVASLYCYEFAGELFYFQAGLDPEWEPWSVGTVLMSRALEYAHARGLKRFDFMRGAEAYKFRWTKETRNMDVVFVGLTLAGKSYLMAREAFDLTKRQVRQFIIRGPGFGSPDAPPGGTPRPPRKR